MGTKIAVEGTQICNTCWLELPVTDFYKHTDYANGRMKRCKVCHNKGTVKRKKQKGSDDYEKRKAKKAPATQGTQICVDCHEELPVTEFYTNANYANGRMKRCKKCHVARTVAQRSGNRQGDYRKRKEKNPPATEGTQVCDVCWGKFPVTDFYANANYANGRMKTCKNCHKERATKLREERKKEELKKELAPFREWWQKNKHKYEE